MIFELKKAPGEYLLLTKSISFHAVLAGPFFHKFDDSSVNFTVVP